MLSNAEAFALYMLIAVLRFFPFALLTCFIKPMVEGRLTLEAAVVAYICVILLTDIRMTYKVKVSGKDALTS